MEIIFLFGTVQAFFLALLIFIKGNKSTGDYVLGSWMVFIGLHSLSFILLKLRYNLNSFKMKTKKSCCKHDAILKIALISVTFGLFFSSSVKGSSGDSLKISRVKIYINANRYRETETRNYTNYTIEDKTIFSNTGNISIAYEWSKRNKTGNEIELMPISFRIVDYTRTINYFNPQSTSLAGEKTTKISSYCRYQFNYYIIKRSKTFVPYIGIATGLKYEREKNKPVVYNVFPVTENNLIISLEIIPGIDFKITDHIFFNLNFPIILNNSSLNFQYIDNPQISENLRKSSTINFDQIPKYFQMRFGLGYKIK